MSTMIVIMMPNVPVDTEYIPHRYNVSLSLAHAVTSPHRLVCWRHSMQVYLKTPKVSPLQAKLKTCLLFPWLAHQPAHCQRRSVYPIKAPVSVLKLVSTA